jgi:hypothetical protein
MQLTAPSYHTLPADCCDSAAALIFGQRFMRPYCCCCTLLQGCAQALDCREPPVQPAAPRLHLRATRPCHMPL